VLAIGNPFGLDQTVTAGIIRAKGRSDVGVADYEDFIQTDAAVNPGNSGGPLVNIRGEVVGINTAIASRTGGYQGIGFTIPINMALKVMQDLIGAGRVIRGWLGVSIQEGTAELRERLGVGDRQGVVVAEAIPGGPAAAAGIQPGDFITHIGERAVASTNQLRNLVASTSVGAEVDVRLLREGEEIILRVRVGDLDQADEVLRRYRESEARAQPKLGITASELTAELAERYHLPAAADGVVITEIEPGSLAAQVGLAPGEVILEVDRQRIRTMDDLDGAIQKIDAKRGVLLRVWSGQGMRMVVLRAR
jgi:serine protease Do